MKRYYDDMEDWNEDEEPSWLESLDLVMERKESTEDDFGTSSSNSNQSPLRRTLVRQNDSSEDR